MAEIIVKVNVPGELKGKFEIALTKLVKQFVRRLEFSMATDILSRSKLTDKQASKLADDLKHRVATRHGI